MMLWLVLELHLIGKMKDLLLRQVKGPSPQLIVSVRRLSAVVIHHPVLLQFSVLRNKTPSRCVTVLSFARVTVVTAFTKRNPSVDTVVAIEPCVLSTDEL